jgi:hypothetical protein
MLIKVQDLIALLREKSSDGEDMKPCGLSEKNKHFGICYLRADKNKTNTKGDPVFTEPHDSILPGR